MFLKNLAITTKLNYYKFRNIKYYDFWIKILEETIKTDIV